MGASSAREPVIDRYVIARPQRFLVGDERRGAQFCYADPAAEDGEISRYQSRRSQ